MKSNARTQNDARPAKATAPAARRGRPRAFNADAALDAALCTFWRNGYEGTSLDDLTAAMGINRPSLYAAFGNKEQLFHRAVDRYVARARARMNDVLAEPTARRAVARFLREIVVGGEGCDAPARSAGRGCLLVGAALTCSPQAEAVRQSLVARRCENERLLRDRLKRAKSEGDLPPDADPAALARYVMTISQGLSVHAAAGVPRHEQLAVVDLALRAWPAAKKSRPRA